MKLFLLLITVAVFFTSCKTDPKYDVADTAEEFIKLSADPNSNIAHNLEDFERMIQDNKDLYSKLKGKPLEEFKRELTFDNGGLSGANTTAVKRILNNSQYEQLWKIFGISGGLFKDYNDRECEKKGTCKNSITDICTSNC